MGCKWAYTLKYNLDCTMQLYKARLAAKRFTRSYGMDYFEALSSAKVEFRKSDWFHSG